MTGADDFQGLVDDLSQTEKMVILIVANSNKIRNTRLQKLSLIVKATLEGKTPASHGAYLFGGFSDEVEEGASALRDEGVLLHDSGEGFSLTKDGFKVAELVSESNRRESDLVKSIVHKFASFNDSKLTAFTYVLFPELTTESVIKEKMEELGKSLDLTEFSLGDQNKLKKLKESLER